MGLFRRLTERLQETRARVSSRLVVIRKSLLQLKNRRKKLKVAVMNSDAVVSEQIAVAFPSGLSNKWRLATSRSRDAAVLPGPCPSVSSLRRTPQCFLFAEDTTGDPWYESENSEEEEEEEEDDSLNDFDWDMSIGSDSVFTDTLSYNDQTWNILVPEDANSKASSLTISSKGSASSRLSAHTELASIADSEDDNHAEKNGVKRAMSDTELHNSSTPSFISSQDSGRFTVHQDYPTKRLDGPLLAVAKLARPLLPTVIHRNDWYSPPKNFRPTIILTAEC